MCQFTAANFDVSMMGSADTITMGQSYLDYTDEDAQAAMDHDLRLDLDRVLPDYADVHPSKVVAVLRDYAERYLAEHKQWDRWTIPDFYELTEGLDQIRSTNHEDLTLQDVLAESSAATQRTFVDLCARDLETFGELTLARRADLALMVLAQEAELGEVSSNVFATLESMNGNITVSSLTLEGSSHIAIEPQGADLTSAQARDLAAGLIRVADILDGECE